MYQSIATIKSPEFINLKPLDINPLMSFCEIKVLYLGENRNRSFISKQVATEMAKTLRGAPIVGYYKESKQDFADHGQQMILDDEGIHFNCLTKPYGFVSPDAKIWFQDFEDQDDFGNSKIRTYLMTTGYLWTQQFNQAKQILNNSKGQSMQLDEKTIKGKWSTDIKEDIDFFIINDAIFSKLCILGDDVQPCFEGASITITQPNTSFTLDHHFKSTLFQMMEELKLALKGGNTVADIKDEKNIQQEEKLNFSLEKNQDKESENQFTENNNNCEDEKELNFVAKEEEQKKQQEEEKDEQNQQEEKDDDEKKSDKYNLLKEEFDTLNANYTTLQNELKELREFKRTIENQQKDNLINQFYMLSDEDKKDVIENKDKYSLEEIESKLAVICFKKKVNFNLEDSLKNDNNMKEQSITTFNIQNNNDDSVPEWIKAVELTMNNI